MLANGMTGLEFLNKIKESGIPQYMVNPVYEYVMNKQPVGDFLTAVFSNNLFEAVGRADNANRECLHKYAMLMYNQFPSDAWGSKEKVKSWLEGEKCVKISS